MVEEQRPTYDQDDDRLHHPEARGVPSVAVVTDVTEGRRGRTRGKNLPSLALHLQTKTLRLRTHTYVVFVRGCVVLRCDT